MKWRLSFDDGSSSLYNWHKYMLFKGNQLQRTSFVGIILQAYWIYAKLDFVTVRR